MGVTPQIQSNSIRGEFKDQIVDTTMKEIHAMIQTVFGPYATDAFIIKDNVSMNKTYYTRDGKEVLKSLSFNDPVANYIKSILYQAVERQGSKIGDGTTTLAVFYTNLYRVIRETDELKGYSLTEIRKVWKMLVNKINALLESISTKEISRDMFASMIYTCTQDAELTKYFTDNIADKLEKDMYVTVNRSASDTEMEVVVHDKPLIKAELLNSLYHMDSMEFNAITLFVNGPLEINNVETFQLLCETRFGSCKNIVIICANTAPNTREVFKKYLAQVGEYARQSGKDISDICNNLIIMKIPDFMQYPTVMVEDLATYIYGTDFITGIISPITFESLLWQSMRSLLSTYGSDVQSVSALETFEFDPKHIDHMKDALIRVYPVIYDETKGLQLSIPMNSMAQNRYDELRKAIDDEKISTKKGDNIKRLKSLYGRFIEVNIGSKLMKDGQRKYELTLDAVLSSVNARTYGALTTNSICAAYCAACEVNRESSSPIESACANIIKEALEKTIYDMVKNAFPNARYEQFDELINTDPILIPIARPFSHNLCGITNPEQRKFKFNLNRENGDEIFDPTYSDPPIEVDGFVIQDVIVEPLPVITSILENSIMMVELACAKMINIGSFIGNYI